METQFDVCVAHERLLDALAIMSATDDDRVPVVASRDTMILSGLITAKAAAVHLGLTDRRPSEVMCREVMSPAPALVRPGDDLSRASELLHRFGLKRLPVVDGQRLVGLLVASRLSSWL